MATNDANVRINVDASNAQKSTDSFRSKVRELTEQMTKLQLAGKENSAEYRALATELGKIKDAMSDTAAQARIMSDDYFKMQAAMEGLSVGVNIFSSLTQVTALLGEDNEELAESLTKVQAAANLANSVFQVTKALNKDTALMTALLTVKEKLLTTATNNQTKAQIALNAAKLGAIGAITAVVAALTVMIAKYASAKNAVADLSKEIDKQAAEHVGELISKVTILKDGWNQLGDSMEERKKYFEEHKKEIQEIDEGLDTMEEFENAIINNTEKFVEAQILRGKAEAAKSLITKKTQEMLEEELKNERIFVDKNRTFWEELLLAPVEWIRGTENIAKQAVEIGKEVKKGYEDEIADLLKKSNEWAKEANKILNGFNTNVQNTSKDTKNTVKEVTALVEDFDAEMEQAMKGVDWRTEKQKSDEFWNSLLFNMDEYQQKGEEIDRESIEWAERQDEILQKQIEAWKAKEKAKEESSKATLAAITQATQIFSSFIEDNMERELAAVEGNEEKEKQIRKKYARAKFMSQIASIGVSTAQAIMEAWSSTAAIIYPGNLIAGGALTAMLAAAGIAQTAKAQQEMRNAMKYEKGGLIEGPRHSNGGVNINAEGGEFVMNRAATQAFLPMLEQMNNIGRPQAVQDVSVFTREQVQNIVTETVKGVTAIPVVVTQNDITNTQRNVSVIQNRSFF